MTTENLQQKAEELFPDYAPGDLGYGLLFGNKLQEKYREIFLAGCAFRSSEAVRFGEWIFNDGYERFWKDRIKKGYDFTTAQLYEQFLLTIKTNKDEND